jgi:hypothetical protein
VASEAVPPRGGFDLVAGREGDPRRFLPPRDGTEEEACFRLERRFHVVKRREFLRRFHGLYKEVTRPPRPPGQGFLFCPHAWPVPGVLRDRAEEGEEAGRVHGVQLVGSPYAEVFPPRLRRYLGGFLRALEVDVVYWEDAVAWADLRAVLRVAFETWDQGRRPALERHFVGIPRVRVTIQEPEEDEGYALPGRAVDRQGPPPLRARVLVIRRDRGEEERLEEVAPPGERVRSPVLVG